MLKFLLESALGTFKMNYHELFRKNPQYACVDDYKNESAILQSIPKKNIGIISPRPHCRKPKYKVCK